MAPRQQSILTFLATTATKASQAYIWAQIERWRDGEGDTLPSGQMFLSATVSFSPSHLSPFSQRYPETSLTSEPCGNLEDKKGCHPHPPKGSEFKEANWEPSSLQKWDCLRSSFLLLSLPFCILEEARSAQSSEDIARERSKRSPVSDLEGLEQGWATCLEQQWPSSLIFGHPVLGERAEAQQEPDGIGCPPSGLDVQLGLKRSALKKGLLGHLDHRTLNP